ncbi:MAG TPA: hypothetical protein VKQ32_11260, partial [Polyangia bacterium]|nr:hypothetical protein [Polyangia bacterium]
MDMVGLRRVLVAALFAGVWMNHSPVESAPSHRFVVTAAQVTDLGTLGGAQSAALDINNSGQVVGWAATAMGIRHAFLSSGGTMSDIGSVFGNEDSEAVGINASGTVAGTLTDQAGSTAFIMNGSAATSLFAPIALNPPFNSTHATGINDAGEVSGGTPFFPTFWFSNAHAAQLAGNGEAKGLNASGVVVGDGDGKGQVWTFKTCRIAPDEACAQDVPLPDPAANYDPVYEAFAISDQGEVVGTATRTAGVPSPVKRAYYWNGAAAASVELGVLPTGSNSHGQDINGMHFIAGYAD